MRSSVAFIVFVVLIFLIKDSKAQVQDSSVSIGGTKYLIYTPPGYSTTGTIRYPLLVSLHGGGEIGPYLSLITGFTVQHHVPAWIIKNTPAAWPATRPYIILTPQLKRDPSVPNYNDQVWPTSVVHEVIEYVKSRYLIDNSKMYLTGVSLGAAGCWEYAAAYPSEVAGLVPFGGNADEAKACLLKDIPIWAFHGENDGFVSPQETITMVNAIKACPEPKAYTPQLNILYTEIHRCWNSVYEGTGPYLIFDWLLQFSKGTLTNTPPYVNAGYDRRMLLRPSSITLSSEYFDAEGTATVQWTKISGPAITLENTNKKFLRLKNLVAGTFEFQATVTDNLGWQSSDRVVLNILSSVPAMESAVNQIQLFNASTNLLVKDLSDDLVINLNTLGTTTGINFKAIVNAETKSLRFKVNDQFPERQFDSNFMVLQNSSNEWNPMVGEYLVCSTPYTSPYKAGTIGIWNCYKISIYNQPVVNYYLKPGGDISNLNSWTRNADGSGAAPLSFSDHFQTFHIQTAGVLNSSLQMNGIESLILVRNGGSLTLNNQLSGPIINAEANSTINVNTNQPITFGTLSPSSTVNFNTASTLIPSATYGNVSLKGTGTSTLSNGTTVIAGNLTIDDKVTLNGGTSSIIELGGNLTISETSTFLPTTLFSLKLTSASQQQINFAANRMALGELIIQGNKTVILNGAAGAVIEMGSPTGGGLSVLANNTLSVKKTVLSIVGSGALNGNGETGTISSGKGSIKLKSNTTRASNIYFVAGADSIRTLSADLTGAGNSLVVRTPVHIVDSVKSYNGTIFSGGNIRLISTGVTNATASISRIEGNGFIDGAIQWQRFVDGEKSYKYLSFPVTGVSVQTLQNYLPITGGFSGSTMGYPTTPSLYQYNETAGGWEPFPSPVQANTETFQIGRGYSIYLRNAADIKFVLTGGIQQGNFPFTLIPNPTASINRGWNLLGNPYPSSILWGGPGWNASGISSAIYIRDNSYPGGKYFVWDGVMGDVEFSGVVAAGQSFWTRVVTNGTPTLTIQESAKHKAGSGKLFRRKEDEANDKVLTVTLRENELYDKAYLKLNPNAKSAFDDQYDAVKKYNGFFSLSTLTSDSVEVAINNTSTEFCNTKIPLSIAATEPGNYSLSFSGSLLSQEVGAIYLIDSYKEDTISVDQSSLYTFSIAEGNLEKSKYRFHLLQQTENPVIELMEGTLSSSYKNGNQWLLNGEEIEGETNSNFKPQVTGSYQVIVQNSTCTLLSGPINFIVNDIPNRLSELMIYPNPTSRYLYIEGLDNSSAQYSIVNALGVTLQNGTLETKHRVNQKRIEIDMDQYASGVYLLTLATKKGTLVHRFIIQPH